MVPVRFESIIVIVQSNGQQCVLFRHEVEEARRYGIPIIVLVDVDKQLAREVIDKYMELGYSWLFDEQALKFFSFHTH